MADAELTNILLVDDRPENLLALESVLDGLGYTIFKANSGQEALRLVLKHDFDLILLDVQMPEMDGFETAKLIHQKKGFQHIPIIFITAISKEPEYIHQGYEAGAVNYLFKPIDPDELKRKVNVALQHQRYKKKMRALEAHKKEQQMIRTH
jgi:CheY-like chemotaxis protein